VVVARRDDGSTSRADALSVGVLRLDTGLLGPAVDAGVALAVADIAEAGGILGHDVEVDTVTYSGDDVDEVATGIVEDGVGLLVGPTTTPHAAATLAIVGGAGIPQCSGSVTEPGFPARTDAGTFYRTIAPDDAEAPALARTVAADGHTDAVIVARADDYGRLVGDALVGALDGEGVTSGPVLTYDVDPTPEELDALADEVVARSPGAVVVVGFSEGAGLVAGLLDRAVPASSLYATEGAYSAAYPAAVGDDPSRVDGMTVVGPVGEQGFVRRVEGDTDGRVLYAATTYDCLIVAALAAEAAGTTDPAEIAAAVPEVTRDGARCTTFGECRTLLADGEDIDYDGASGPLDLDDDGDVTVARYTVARFEGGTPRITGTEDVVVGS